MKRTAVAALAILTATNVAATEFRLPTQGDGIEAKANSVACYDWNNSPNTPLITARTICSDLHLTAMDKLLRSLLENSYVRLSSVEQQYSTDTFEAVRQFIGLRNNCINPGELYGDQICMYRAYAVMLTYLWELNSHLNLRAEALKKVKKPRGKKP